MKIYISSARVVEHNNQKFVLYAVQVLDGAVSTKCERRYSDFYSLHKTLRRLYPGLELPDFPPKKIRSLSEKVTQERRALLQVYLQAAVDHLSPELPRCVLEFLDFDSSVTALLQDERHSSEHQPILSFIDEPFKHSESSTLPNTAVDATLDAIY